ncbi:MAG: translesion error-prone DNA polymerase V autoproteolytic subunit [Patescibacteria group bacterium]
MQIYKTTNKSKKVFVPLYSSLVKAGFPSPADDYINKKIDLNDYFISKPNSTFIVQVSGDSMIGVGIMPNDHLIIDRSKTVKDNSVVLAIVDSEFCVKRYRTINNTIYLYSENKNYRPIKISGEMDFEVWGVVVGVTRKLG